MSCWVRGVSGVGALLLCVSGLVADDTKGTSVPPDAALKRLAEGNARFVIDQSNPRDPFYVQRAKLADGQRPIAVILTCADSRVSPELVFNQQLGDVFVVRVAGNVTSPEILGSIEYAVEHLGPTLIVVLGHTKCGAVSAALSGEKLEGNLGVLIKRVAVGSDLPKEKTAALDAAVDANVVRQAQQLTKESSVLKDLVSSDRIRIVGGTYDLKSGKVKWLGKEKSTKSEDGRRGR
jgi:carbonic anhydrase